MSSPCTRGTRHHAVSRASFGDQHCGVCFSDHPLLSKSCLTRVFYAAEQSRGKREGQRWIVWALRGGGLLPKLCVAVGR